MPKETVTTVMVVVVLILSMVAVAATVAYYQDKSATQEYSFALEKSVEDADLTTKSYTYIPLNLFGLSREDGEKKLEGIVATWEKENPERTFLGMGLRRVPSTGHVVGVAIYSKSKCGCPCPE